MRFVATPRRTPRRGSLCVAEELVERRRERRDVAHLAGDDDAASAAGCRASWSSRADAVVATARRDWRAELEADELAPDLDARRAAPSRAGLLGRRRSPYEVRELDLLLQIHVHTSAARRRPLVGRAGDWKSVKPARSSRPRSCSRRRRARERDLGRDDPPQRQVGERLLHRLHAARGARLHDRVDLLDLRLPDQVPDGVVGHQDLERRGAAAPSAVGTRFCVTTPWSVAASCTRTCCCCAGGERVDDAVDRLRRALGVQRREDEVAGLGGGQRGRDRLEVAHLADEDHVRVLAQRRAQALGERRRVLADLALVDDAAPVLVEELDRILDREDVLRARRG